MRARLDPAEPINWPRIFRALCRRYHWTPDVVWSLSIQEIRMFLSRGGPSKDARGPSIADIAAKINKSRAERGLSPLPVKDLVGLKGK